MRSIAGRRWLERPLYDAPLPLVVNNWPALDDPVPPFEVHDRRSQSCHWAVRREALLCRSAGVDW